MDKRERQRRDEYQWYLQTLVTEYAARIGIDRVLLETMVAEFTNFVWLRISHGIRNGDADREILDEVIDMVHGGTTEIPVPVAVALTLALIATERFPEWAAKREE